MISQRAHKGRHLLKNKLISKSILPFHPSGGVLQLKVSMPRVIFMFLKSTSTCQRFY